jgi:uncharacterized protein YraI
MKGIAMNKKSPIYLIKVLILASLLIVSCGPQDLAPSAPQSWIDAPLPGSTIPLAPYQITAHAGFPSGISQFELTITGQGPENIPAPSDQAGQTLVNINHMWTPPAPGMYLIQVRAAGPDGAYGQVVEVQVQVGDVPEVETSTPEAQACMWTATVNVFVREGPGASIYPEITAVENGTVLPVIGQSQDGQFWVVQVEGQSGYVPKAERYGQTSGNCDVPPLTDPATPVPTNVPVVLPQCSDGFDNDGDGRVDYGTNVAAGVNDRECTSPEDNDEANR